MAAESGTALVDAYLADTPENHREALQAVRGTIMAAVPDAIELISYGMPALKYRGKWLVSYASFKVHCSIFPGATTHNYRDELTDFKLGKGTIQFTPDHLLPAELVTRIVRDRAAVIDAGGD